MQFHDQSHRTGRSADIGGRNGESIFARLQKTGDIRSDRIFPVIA